jgi:outer membrane protein assembly factor BamA
VTFLLISVWLASMAPGRGAAPVAAASNQQQAVVAEIQVHGNLATPEETILELAGVAVGTPFDEELPGRVADRLREADRFDNVEVLKRFASISDLSQIVLVIVVDDGPVIVNWGEPDPAKRIARRRSGARPMFLPIVNREDGYGFTYGARIAFADRTRGTRLSFPLTWGGHKRAGAEFEVSPEDGLVTRLTIGAAITREVNPFFRLDDDRRSLWVRAERRIDAVVAGVLAGVDGVSFNGEDDRLTRFGGDIVVDTRLDPWLAREAVYARASWERIEIDGQAVARREVDLRGYLGLNGQNVLVVRGLREDASGPLPPYLQPLLGGSRNLRGVRAGFDAGDMLMAASVEVLAPITSPLSIGKTGVSAFMDVGAAYGSGESVHRQKFDRAIGGSFWVSLTVARASVTVARGLGQGTRAHVTVGTTF